MNTILFGARTRIGFTLEDMAVVFNRSYSTVSRWDDDNKMPEDVKLYLKIIVEYLERPNIDRELVRLFIKILGIEATIKFICLAEMQDAEKVLSELSELYGKQGKSPKAEASSVAGAGIVSAIATMLGLPFLMPVTVIPLLWEKNIFNKIDIDLVKYDRFSLESPFAFYKLPDGDRKKAIDAINSSGIGHAIKKLFEIDEDVRRKKIEDLERQLKQLKKRGGEELTDI